MIWQPIETAPKDGTEILLTSGIGTPVRSPHFIGYFIARTGKWWNMWQGAPHYLEPTHWMPLPAIALQRPLKEIPEYGNVDNSSEKG